TLTYLFIDTNNLYFYTCSVTAKAFKGYGGNYMIALQYALSSPYLQTDYFTIYQPPTNTPNPTAPPSQPTNTPIPGAPTNTPVPGCDNSCQADTCIGSSCIDSCGNTVPGTKTCSGNYGSNPLSISSSPSCWNGNNNSGSD